VQPSVLRILSARRGLTVFLGGVGCLAIWQVWLTWQLVDQDRNLELQRSRERLGQIADLAVVQLAGRLGEWELSLKLVDSLPPPPSINQQLPGGATLILIARNSVTTFPARPLLFRPELPAAQAYDEHLFDTADELELREQRYVKAMAELESLERQPATRAAALLRLARIEHKMGRWDAALNTYAELASEPALTLSGSPYALLAAAARCRILREVGRKQQAISEAEALRKALLEGRWPMRREVFEYHWSVLAALGIETSEPPKSAYDFSAFVTDVLSPIWQGAQTPGQANSGRKEIAGSALLLWDATPSRLCALVTSPDWLSSTLKLPPRSDDVRWEVISGDDRGSNGITTRRSLAEAQLPGRIEFSLPQPTPSATLNRHALWFVGVALMLAVVLGSGYVLRRAIARELRVAQLQSDFVAAVSHEFRSPLTTLRTITELLAQDRIPDEGRRRRSYVFLDRETNRLHRLVEDLLDFGRMESGRKQYRMEFHDAFQLVQAAVADIGEQAVANGFQVETNLEPTQATVHADEEAFRRALRNLLENAMKYSPECRTVWVDGAILNRRVVISVRDNGIGIAPGEQGAIFQKFVRGDAAKKAGIKGTGIGLAMVRQISDAMGGEIHVESEVGVGSTFTLVLPLAQE
jgi:signal transduction histidine kinase/tetratricopeptide (TPR) repeat protein